MGRISPAHVAGLDLVDKLFFNQILVSCVFTEELVWMKELDRDVERALTSAGVAASRRQVVKHVVLCLLEAGLADSLLSLGEAHPGRLPPLPAGMTAERFEDVESYQLDFFRAYVLAMADQRHGCGMDLPDEIAGSLLSKYAAAPATFRYRLAERMFAFNFLVAPIDAFTWLSRMGVLNSEKHRGDRLKARYSSEFLQRLALLCEFDLLREHIARTTARSGQGAVVSLDEIRAIRQISSDTRTLLLAKMKKELELAQDADLRSKSPFIALAELEQPDRVQRFFADVNVFGIRFRTFRGSLASWVGMLCGGFVEVMRQNENSVKPIYVAESNDDTHTKFLVDGMLARGFRITPRVISDRHRDFRETVLKAITAYYNLKLVENVALPPDVKDTAYEAITWHLDSLKPPPRRASRCA